MDYLGDSLSHLMLTLSQALQESNNDSSAKGFIEAFAFMSRELGRLMPTMKLAHSPPSDVSAQTLCRLASGNWSNVWSGYSGSPPGYDTGRSSKATRQRLTTSQRRMLLSATSELLGEIDPWVVSTLSKYNINFNTCPKPSITSK